MRERIEERLRELHAEFETGRGMLAELDARRASINGSLLRIGGAIHALEEILLDSDARPDAEANENGVNAAAPHEALAVGQV